MGSQEEARATVIGEAVQPEGTLGQASGEAQGAKARGTERGVQGDDGGCRVVASSLSIHSLFLISFSSLRMREDSCSGVGALKEREGVPSLPEGGVGNLCLKSSIMLLCSLRFRPCGETQRESEKAQILALHKQYKRWTNTGTNSASERGGY